MSLPGDNEIREVMRSVADLFCGDPVLRHLVKEQILQHGPGVVYVPFFPQPTPGGGQKTAWQWVDDFLHDTTPDGASGFRGPHAPPLSFLNLSWFSGKAGWKSVAECVSEHAKNGFSPCTICLDVHGDEGLGFRAHIPLDLRMKDALTEAGVARKKFAPVDKEFTKAASDNNNNAREGTLDEHTTRACLVAALEKHKNTPNTLWFVDVVRVGNAKGPNEEGAAKDEKVFCEATQCDVVICAPTAVPVEEFLEKAANGTEHGAVARKMIQTAQKQGNCVVWIRHTTPGGAFVHEYVVLQQARAGEKDVASQEGTRKRAQSM